MPNSHPNGFVNFLGRIGDRIVPGNNWNPNAAPGQRWSATPTQYGVAGARILGNMISPGLGSAISSGYNGATTGHGPLGFLQGLFHHGTPGGDIARTPIPGSTGTLAPPGVGVTGPNLSPVTATGPGAPTTAPAPQTGPTPQITGPSFFGPQTPQPWYVNHMAGLTGPMSGNGGARGAIGWNGPGITDPAAIRAFMEASRFTPQFQITNAQG